MTPVLNQDAITIYCGDCLEVLKELRDRVEPRVLRIGKEAIRAEEAVLTRLANTFWKS